MRSPEQHQELQATADQLAKDLGIGRDDPGPATGLVLGTGWGDVLRLDKPREANFGFPGLRLLEGHARQVIYGELAGTPVLVLRGRIHLNESFSTPNAGRYLRLQIETLVQLGVRTLILTSAVGGLAPDLAVGDILIADSFITLFAPDMPLNTGEFVSPEDALDSQLRAIALRSVPRSSEEDKPALKVREGALAMVRGPFFEGRRHDKGILRSMGADAVGMSILPEACIAALYRVRVLALSYVTNSAVEEHSHETNQRRVRHDAHLLGDYLKNIAAALA